MLQVERHAYLQQPNLMRMCEDEGIVVTGFSPLGSSSYVEIDMATKQDSALKEPAVLSVAEKHGKTPAQVLLRWGVQTGACIIPKSVKEARLAENLDIFDFELDQEDLQSMQALEKGHRFNDPGTVVSVVWLWAFAIDTSIQLALCPKSQVPSLRA